MTDIRVFDSDANRLGPIDGRKLLAQYSTACERALREYVASSPDDALRKISTNYSSLPSISGRNSREVAIIRNAISQYSSEEDFGSAFMIVAPHTHWRKGLPILLSFDGKKYLLSEKAPREEIRYCPVSFAFTPSGLLAYEWIDETVRLPLEDMLALWQCAEWIAEEIGSTALGFGLSINFRFKNPMDKTIVSTIEFQDPSNRHGGSIIERADKVEEDRDNLGKLEQVAWHARMDNCDGLSEQEAACFLEIRDLIDNVPDGKARMLLWNRIFGNQ